MVLDQFNAAAAPHGLQFGPDVATSSRANIGGMIGNNSAGARSIWHGKTVDNVIALDVVLSDGSVDHVRSADAARAARSSRPRTDLVGHDPSRGAADRGAQSRRNRGPLSADSAARERLQSRRIRARVPRPLSHAAAGAKVRAQREARMYPGAEFNLAKLIVGAEGTLATITEALVHLLPLPKVRGMVVLHFDSMAHAVASVEHDARLRAVGRRTVRRTDPAAGREEPGVSQLSRLRRRPARVAGAGRIQRRAAPTKCRPRPMRWSRSSRPAGAVSRPAGARQETVRSRLGLPQGGAAAAAGRCRARASRWRSSKTRAVSPEHLPRFVERFREIMARHDTEGAFYGHASVGCLHIRPMLDLREPIDIDRLQQISHEVCDLVMEFGGAMSGEHGDGLARSYLNERLFGPRLYQAFKQVKAAFDPHDRMNPGKVVDGPSPIENLRYGTDYKTHRLPTTFDFSREGGFARAVEMCNGAGVCRKLQTGTMCPSFMATRDEEHSTRGRANALRLVLSGALPPEELTGERLFDTYDLCLQCKGCKAECPSNVDVAKLKMEFLNGYYRQHGAPLGVRLMAHAARLNELGSALAPLSNWAARLPGAGWLAERLLGIDRRRPLPRFERHHFRKWFRKRPVVEPTARAPRGPIVLLDDCLTSYCEPGVNRAAVQVLEAAGYEVHLAGLGLLRPHAGLEGFLTEAQELARRNIERLLPWAERGVPIVGCEPSCLVMLVDEYPDLVPGDAARAVAAQAALVDTHLVQRQDSTAAPLADAQKILVHGHCHQKALVGVADTRPRWR